MSTIQKNRVADPENETAAPRTLVERAYLALRQDVVCGKLAPSERLRVEHLKDQYEVGAGTLREALSLLVSDALVTSEGQRGFRVAPISLADLEDVTNTRVMLETEALRQSIRHGDAQWETTLASYASPVIGSKHVRDVTVGDVLAIIEPHWTSKNETMVRTRNRIELVLGWAASRGYRDKQNPAQWRGNLQHALPKPSKVNNRQHHAALPYREVHQFMQKLAQVDGMSAKALQWLILTACRSGEARGATWDEIDLEAGLWTIPASRMKAGREHRIPLSVQALELLEALPRFEQVEGKPDYIFTGRAGGELSDMSLTVLIRRMKLDATAHGFRSTFADWAAEQTSYPIELREMALAHTLGDKTREAYQRGDMMERRRAMMGDWATYLTTPTTSASIIPLRGAA